jgi:hypothetical protein
MSRAQGEKQGTGVFHDLAAGCPGAGLRGAASLWGKSRPVLLLPRPQLVEPVLHVA